MKIKLPLIFASALLLAGCSSESNGKWDDPNPIQPTADLSLSGTEADANDGLNKFGIDFFNAAAIHYDAFFSASIQDNHDNYSVSPLSASLALAMLANSGDDAITSATLKVLNAPDIADLNNACNKIMRYMAGRKNVELANSIWYSSSRCKVTDSYVRNINRTFYAEVNGVDFTDKSVAGKMNAWIHNKTHGYIGDMIQRTDDRSIVFLINALYFKGKWDDSFKKDKTTKATFHGTESNSEIDMMHSHNTCRYVKQDRLSAIIKPLEGDAAMAFLLPEGNTDIKELSATISCEEWQGIVNNAKACYDGLSLPKFKINSDADLSPWLNSIGLSGYNSKLDKMGDVRIDDHLYLKTKQKAILKVEEEGVTAAAVTVIGAFDTAMPDKSDEVVFTLDRPFLYFLFNRTSGTILMAGRICNL